MAQTYSHHGMRSLDKFGPARGVFAVEELVRRAVHALPPVNHLAECGRQLVVGCVATGPERVAAHLGNGVVMQVPGEIKRQLDCGLRYAVRYAAKRYFDSSRNDNDGDLRVSRRLVLVGHISVPALSTERVAEVVVEYGHSRGKSRPGTERLRVRHCSQRPRRSRGLANEPDDCCPGKPRDVCILRVHLNFAKVGAQLQLLLRAQILVPEEDDASLRDQESKFILRPI